MAARLRRMLSCCCPLLGGRGAPLLLCLALAAGTPAAEPPAEETPPLRVLWVSSAGMLGVTAWGVVQWDYFSRSPHQASEGWFGADTEAGGMDKLGHLYTSYVLSHGFSALYESWDVPRNDAAACGALTSFLIMGYMEFGDSFSDYGFSCEDFLMNTCGAAFGYLLYSRPALAAKIDLRWQFGPSPSQGDFTTDYENSKFLLALKLNGFDAARPTFWRYVELHLGYYAEGFDDAAKDKARYLYAGLGFNLTDLIRRHGYRKTATFFNYVQLPYTSINYDHEL